MTTHPGLHVAPTTEGTGTLPRDARLAQGGLLAPASSSNLSVRTGVLFDNGNAVVSGTTGLAINVRPCRVVSKFSDGNGPTVFAVSATESPTMAAAPGSGSRIDIVYALQPLVTGDGGDGGTSVQPVVGYVAGSPSGAPTAPAIPAGAVELGRGTVSAGMVRSNQVAWSKPQWTVANGGVLPSTATDLRVWNGSEWTRLANTKAGLLTPSSWVTPIRTPQWIQVGDQVTLHGVLRRDPLVWSTDQTVSLGISPGPLPAQATTQVVRTGDRIAAVNIDTSGVLTINNTIGSGGNTNDLFLDGITYRTATV